MVVGIATISALQKLKGIGTMPKVFIGVGANLGDREKTIQRAHALLGSLRGIRFVQCSGVIETDPVGGPAGQERYLNAVWQIQSDLSPRELLGKLLGFEMELGRKRNEKDGPRTIDLDILFYDQEIHNDRELIVPHPRLHERAFVLEPLAELAPDLVHPMLNKTIKELLSKLGATLSVERKNETHPRS